MFLEVLLIRIEQSITVDHFPASISNLDFVFFPPSPTLHAKAASAPATPLMSKPRATFITRSNTVSKHYDSNTLPSEMPKKRRAPLPPMPSSQSAPQELAQAQVRPTSDIVKSNSLDSSEQVSYVCFTSLRKFKHHNPVNTC